MFVDYESTYYPSSAVSGGCVAHVFASSFRAEQAPNVVEIEVQFAGAATVAKDRLLANMRTRVGQ
ncbi:MAG: hypothetical protein ORN83_12870, partial [Chthoniobacteraceae bacterium]|nr:hypothetical protein [Chthoniobacteraceae bacterium]